MISHFGFLYVFFYILENMEDNNNIIRHAGTMYENKMLEKEHQNNPYQNTNRNDNLLVLIFYFLQIPINKKS